MSQYRTSPRNYRQAHTHKAGRKSPVQGVSINRALRLGHLYVTLPTLLLGIGPFIFSEALKLKQVYPLGFFLPLAIAWFYRSYAVTKWKIWAYTHVEDVHRLRTKARRQALLALPGSRYEKSEIRSRRDKEKLLALRAKFDLSYPGAPALPEKTFIYYSRWKLGAGAVIALIIGLVALGTVGRSEYFWVGYLIAIGMLFVAGPNIRLFFNRIPQLILSRRGIEIRGKKFYPWEQLKNLEVEIRQASDSRQTWLVYTHGKKEEELNLDNHAISKEELDILIRRYRSRSTPGTAEADD